MPILTPKKHGNGQGHGLHEPGENPPNRRKEGLFVPKGAADTPGGVFCMQKGAPDTAAGGFCMLKSAPTLPTMPKACDASPRHVL